MLKIFNDLSPFFEDNYRRINIREYARILKISPPSASKTLKAFAKEGLLVLEEDKNYLNFSTNKVSNLFLHLSRLYWFQTFDEIGFLDYLEKELIAPTIILFGSFAKAEVRKQSDIDIAIFSDLQNELNFDVFEQKLQRKIQQFRFESRDKVPTQELLNNILSGFILMGGW
ncbi:MAG: nucleotidyltransferase domain-containing protein [Candidatus Heimdallarchaeota archaeon]